MRINEELRLQRQAPQRHGVVRLAAACWGGGGMRGRVHHLPKIFTAPPIQLTGAGFDNKEYISGLFLKSILISGCTSQIKIRSTAYNYRHADDIALSIRAFKFRSEALLGQCF